MHSELTIDNKKAFGQFIKAKRRKKGYKQAKVASLLGVEPKTISHIERGKHYPSMDNMFTLAKILDMSVDEFIFGYSKFDANFCIEDINKMLLELSESDKNTVIATTKALCDSLTNKDKRSK